MARKGMEPMHDEHVNVTPLIDVIMCLIIFFLVVGRLVKDEMVDMVIPRAQLGQEMDDQQNRLTINIVPVLKDKDGNEIPPGHRPPPTVLVRGRPVITTTDGWTELTKALRAEKAENPDLKVVLRADQDQTYEWIAPALVACAQANIKNVNFSTKLGDAPKAQ
jgi:biopolymer transport protein ExbD